MRFIAFDGAAIAIAIGLNLIPDPEFHLGLEIVWPACVIIVLIGEYDLGSKRVAYAMIFTTVVLNGGFTRLAMTS